MKSNGQSDKGHKHTLNILLESGAEAEKLMPAIAHCFVDVMNQLEKSEKRRESIELRLFGDKETKQVGLIDEIEPIIKAYNKFGWLPAVLWAIIVASFGFIGAWLKNHFFN